MIPQEDLEKIGFLRNLGERHLAQIALLAQIKECAEGSVVFSEGQDSSCIYFVLSGQIALEVRQSDGKSVEVFTANPGELVGWSPVLGRNAMTATARAKTRCRLAVFDVSKILEMCETFPRFGLAFLREIGLALSDRLWATRHRLAGVLGNRPPMGSVVEGSD
jgi:CRP/FNR family cyclic AMP-dependent transcriptional regulator